MSDPIPQVEITDSVGETSSYCGSVTETPINIPPVAGDRIEEIAIRCTIDQPFLSRLEFSYDGGTNWHRLAVGEAREDQFRGSIKQIKIRAAGVLPTCNYEIIMNRGPI